MNASNAVLDRIAARHNLRSDYAIAKAFGCDPSRIYNYRNGRSSMDDVVAVQAAELAGEQPEPLLIELAAERSKDEKTKAAWMRVGNLIRRASKGARAAGAVLALGMLVAAPPNISSGKALRPI